MTPDRWTMVEALFDAALDQPAEARDAWLRSNCVDPQLRHEILELISASERSVDFLVPPAQVFAADLVVADDGALSRRVGAYRLVHEISRGGMGVVYLAERADGQYERQVAVKLLRRALDSAALRRRFANERQILASLTHSNIAGLLDGGVTDDGQPYLVMTYVDGMPIDAYCRQNGLSLEAKLRLFLVACEAVQYAHQQLVVHRDLKPSNIFVTPHGDVKLLDFGIAKLLADDAGEAMDLTQTGIRLMTPEYASPEQVSGAPVSTSSDVYQLGLLLYELLTGERAYSFTSSGLQEIAHVVCEVEPLPVSRVALDSGNRALAARLRGELDAIVSTALRKEPERRYASVSLLAEDVRRYLAGHPVTAHGDSALYRLRKFVQRNWVPVGAAVVVLLLIVAYALTMTVQRNQIARERDRTAEYATLLTDVFSGADPYSTGEIGPETTLRRFLDLTTERIQSELDYDPELQASLLRTIADVELNLGDDSTAHSMFRRLLPEMERRFGRRSNEYVEVARKLAESTQDVETADSLHRVHVALARDLDGGAGPRTARGLSSYGLFLNDQGRFEEADRLLNEAFQMVDEVDGETRLSIAYVLAGTYQMQDRLAEADSMVRLAYESASATFGPTHPRTAIVMTRVATVAEARGDLDASLHWKLEALEILEERLGAEHPYSIAQLNNVAVLYGLRGDYAASEQLYRRVLAWREKTLGPDDPETVAVLQNIGASLLKQGRLDEAEPLLIEAHERYNVALPPDHYLRAFPSLSLADLYDQKGLHTESEAVARRAVDHLRATLTPGHPLVAVAMSRQGRALTGLGRYGEAEALLLEAFALLEKAEGFATYRQEAANALTELYERLGREGEAGRYGELALIP